MLEMFDIQNETSESLRDNIREIPGVLDRFINKIPMEVAAELIRLQEPLEIIHKHQRNLPGKYVKMSVKAKFLIRASDRVYSFFINEDFFDEAIIFSGEVEGKIRNAIRGAVAKDFLHLIHNDDKVVDVSKKLRKLFLKDESLQKKESLMNFLH